MNPLHSPRVIPPSAWPSGDERGLTLTELTIVGVLATLVMLALTAFYFNSQKMWIEGSTQALAQRDATLLVDDMRRRVHEAQKAAVYADSDQVTLSLSYASPAFPQVDYRWLRSDQRLRVQVVGLSSRPVVDTPVCTFVVTPLGSTLVELTLAQLRSADGDTVSISSRFGLLGR